jgi:2-keto-4-pentenoate hydratase/2-oxohepta-3-ene-1,7-dioic acid hydratase in catechol pathway
MRIAVVDGALGALDPEEGFHPIGAVSGPDPLLRALDAGLDLRQLAAAALEGPAVAQPDRFDPPILRPSKIMGIGLNYRDHCREVGAEEPSSPVEFSKHPSSIVGAGADVPLDSGISEEVDYEIELAVVIGRRCRDLDEQDALDFVAGYTVANDISARNLQFGEGQWVRAKSFDGFCPLGPTMVTPDEIPDPQRLTLRTEVSGTVLQDSSTSEMIFSVAQLLTHVSQRTTLEPGDLLLTGTPWGTGGFRHPQRFLIPGDVVSCTIEGVGTLTNPVVAAPALPRRQFA